MTAANIIGSLATVCMVLGYLPQAIHTIRKRDTDGIAMPTFILLFLGSIFFVVQGILISNYPLVIANSVTAVCSAIVFCIKIYNDYIRK